MQKRHHSLITGKEAIRNALPYIRFFTDKHFNTLTLTCIERDHWSLTQKAIEIFKGFPITFGHYNGGEYSYVKICEILPMVINQKYLSMVVKEGK